MLGWTPCKRQFWQPCWKPFAQHPEVFRAQSENFSQNIYFGHVESYLDNPAEKFQLKLRKVFKKVQLNKVPSHLKKRNFGTPPKEVTQKVVLKNLSKTFLLEARKHVQKTC